MKKCLFPVLIVFAGFISCQKPEDSGLKKLQLWYDQPATIWTEALPLGNGRLGAMVFGDTLTERIQLNEESLWTGGPINRANPEASEYLNKVRQLLFDNKYAEAEVLAQEKLMGKRIDPGLHTFQTLGDLFLGFQNKADITNYKRSLNLNEAIARVAYDQNDVHYQREAFSSAADNVVVIRLSASQKNKLSFSLWMNRPGNAENTEIEDNRIVMKGFAEYQGRGTHFHSILQVLPLGGETEKTDTSLIVRNASEVVLLLSARTDFWGGKADELAEKDINNASKLSYAELKEKHVNDYQKLFTRVQFTLNEEDTLNLPTNSRLERVKSGAYDPHLSELYFQYGRYLLISSSRPGGLPANLQGIWDPTLSPPWNADYHININIQMNYWPALLTNLAECQEPYFDFVEGLRERGRITAREMYGARGFVAHHTTDVWKFTDPIGKTYYGLWPMGAAWCSDHFWEHFDYTNDREFLEERTWPLLKEAALFFVDYLVEDPETGLLVSGPGMSPENNFITDEGKRASICMGPAMDHQIITELFTNCIKTAEILQTDAEFSDSLKMLLEKLTPAQIGSDGRILEWSEEVAEWDSGHRHLSHLYALHPGDQFADPNDKWMEAARKSIETRLSHGGGHTGWSRAWIINFFARLQDGEKAHENLLALYSKSTHPNLFDNHPPFQIDGNFGATAGIAEMLMQSHRGVIRILPALPDKWHSGEIRGLRARGGFEVDIEWEDGTLVALRLKSFSGNPCKLSYLGQIAEYEMEAGEEMVLDGELKKKI